jgi:uncharacterized iron-regulated membrane protein
MTTRLRRILFALGCVALACGLTSVGYLWSGRHVPRYLMATNVMFSGAIMVTGIKLWRAKAKDREVTR